MQIVLAWLPVTGKFPSILFMLHAAAAIWYNCKRLTATQVKFVCDWRRNGNNLNATGSQYSTKLPVFESTLPEQLFE
jgi:hypothetical protein